MRARPFSIASRYNYPILPEIDSSDPLHPAVEQARRELLHIRNYSLFVPRDFDVSPYFRIVKPKLQQSFDFHRLKWAEAGSNL